jgi:hypothetical protein
LVAARQSKARSGRDHKNPSHQKLLQKQNQARGKILWPDRRRHRHRTILFALGGSDPKLLTNLDSVAVNRDPALQKFHVTDGQPDGTPAP